MKPNDLGLTKSTKKRLQKTSQKISIRHKTNRTVCLNHLHLYLNHWKTQEMERILFTLWLNNWVKTYKYKSHLTFVLVIMTNWAKHQWNLTQNLNYSILNIKNPYEFYHGEILSIKKFPTYVWLITKEIVTIHVAQLEN